MAGRLSIRRVGNILPTLSLVGLLLVIGILIWLCTAGLPGCALRYIEKEAAAAGINLSIDKIKLYPRSGLAFKAEKIGILQEQPDAAPVALHLKKARISFSLARLLSGDYRPSDIQISGGKLVLPLSHTPGDELVLKELGIYTTFFRNTNGISANLTARLCDAELQVKLGSIQGIPEFKQEQAEESTGPDLPAILAELRPTLREVKTQLETQEWTEEVHPAIAVSLYASDKWKAQLKASIPNYDIRNFRFRDAELDAVIDNNTFSVNSLKFRTIAPDTRVTLHGSYNWEERELEFSTISTAPIVKMLNGYLGEDTPPALRKLKSEGDHTPTIELSGHAVLSEDFAFHNFSIRGKIEQNNLHFGAVPIKQAHLSFFMRNGQFSIDTLKLTMPDGHIMGEAFAANEKGYANLDLSLPDETLLALAQELSGDSGLALPEGLVFDSDLKLQARINLSLPDFEPGKSHLHDLVPQLGSCEFQFSCDKILYSDNQLNTNTLTLRIQGIDYSQETTLQATEAALDARIGSSILSENQGDSSETLLSLKLEKILWNHQESDFSLQQAELNLSSGNARWENNRADRLQVQASITSLQGKASDIAGTLTTDALGLHLRADTIVCGENKAHGIFLNAEARDIPFTTSPMDYLQTKGQIEFSAQEFCGTHNLTAKDITSYIRKDSGDKVSMSLYIPKGSAYINMGSSLTLLPDSKLQISSSITAHSFNLSTALADYLPQELRLPDALEAKAAAVIDPEAGRVDNCQYQLELKQLRRVCHNVHVHKGMEIPLNLQVNGNFTTAADGGMHYAADVKANHKLGEMNLHVKGDPLRDCRITGSSTMPVNIINALIDNEDAHWIMRDFRCQDGITRNNITNIDTTIRYDKGVYVHACCDAELRDMDFLLGALQDKLDAQGNPTGEEYLRTDLGKDPYSRIKHGTCGVEVLVQLDCVGADGKPLADRIDINLLNPDLVYDNKPWLRRMGIRNGAPTSRIKGEAVRFNIEDCTISLHKLKGSCYPAYSIGMYYAPIQHFLSDVILESPADIETDYCIFPLSRRCEIPMKGLIRASAAKGAGYRFLGTTIPFTNFSGFINISDVDVYLDRMNAQCWGGKLDGSLRINFAGEHTTLDGYFVANTLNLKDIVASYGEEFTPASCSGYIRFQAPEPTLEAIRGYGQVHLTDGDLMQIGLFRPIGAFLSDVPGNLDKLQKSVYLRKEDAQPTWVDKFIRNIFDSGSNAVDVVQTSAYKVPFANHFLRYGIDEAFARFDILNGHLISRDMKARGYNLDVDMQLDINLDKLTLDGDLWPRISSVPTLLISPITILSDFLIDINVYGDLISPKWKFGLSKKLKGAADSVSSEPQQSEQLKTE